MEPIIDPRRGDFEDDASSTKRRSLLSLAGSLLVGDQPAETGDGLDSDARCAEPAAWACSARGFRLAQHGDVEIASPYRRDLAGHCSLRPLLAVGWFGGRPLLRLVESSFWSLNSLAVEPIYAICPRGAAAPCRTAASSTRSPRPARGRLRAAAAAAAGVADLWSCAAGADAGLAQLALGGRHLGSGFPAPPGSRGFGQQRRAGRRLSRGGRARIGQSPMRPWPSPATFDEFPSPP